MAAFNRAPSQSNPQEQLAPSLTETTKEQEGYLSATVDNSHTSLKSLITNIEGLSWHVTYYQQILGSNSETRAQDVYGSAIYQQYRKIKRFELKVSSGLESSYDSERGEHSLSGEAAMYPSFIPNVGDMIVAALPNGRTGILNIHGITPMSIYNERVYTIQYKFSSYFEGTAGTDLDDKTVETVTFNYNYLINGKNPFLSDKRVANTLSLRRTVADLVDSYYAEFWSRKFRTWISPLYKHTPSDEPIYVYDGCVVEVLNAILNDDLRGSHPLGVVHNTSDGINEGFTTIYDAMLKVAPFLVGRVERYKRLVPVSAFYTQGALQPIHYSGISAVVWPLDVKSIGESTPQGIKYYINDDPYEHTPYYVFSEAFYIEDTVHMTPLERMAYKYLEDEAVDLDELMGIISESATWTSEMRFYLYPIIFMIINVNVGRGM